MRQFIDGLDFWDLTTRLNDIPILSTDNLTISNGLSAKENNLGVILLTPHPYIELKAIRQLASEIICMI